MPGGDGLTSAQRLQIDRAIREAETACRQEFSVYVGRADEQYGEPRAFAHRLHASLVNPSRSVLLMVDPGHRAVEIVTGAEVRRSLSDDEVSLALAEMTSCFELGEIVNGIVHGIEMLAAHAQSPRTLHR